MRIAGGLTVGALGYRLLFHVAQAARLEVKSGKSIALFPRAMPGISGPGAIAVMVSLSTEIAGVNDFSTQVAAYLATIACIGVTCATVWLLPKFAHPLARWVGEDCIDAMTRFTGFMLICLGVQFIGSGIRAFYAGLSIVQ